VGVTNEHISALVAQLLAEKAISANELARRMGLSSGRISEKLNSKASWKFCELFTLADALDLNPADVVIRLVASSAPPTP